MSSCAEITGKASSCYDVAGFLHPVTPSHSSRYGRNARVQVASQLITARLYTSSQDPEPQYLPPNWSTHVQPEGQRYFYNGQTGVITEAYLFRVEIFQRVLCWSRAIEEHVKSNRIELPEGHELFLELGKEESDGCKYYYVDHASRSLFWLNDVTTDDLDISPTTSSAQLRWAFAELYYTHVEYFPSHGVNIPHACIEDLVSVLTQARADHLTSSCSTFPYTGSQCSDFLDLIHKNVPTGYDAPALRNANYIWIVARIWSQIAHHRFSNFYGEENARLSRDQCMLQSEPIRNPVYMKLLACILFNETADYERSLDNTWIDEVVYAEAWKAFISRARQNWNESGLWSFALLIIHSVFLSLPGSYKPLSAMALALSVSALSASIVLTKYHNGNDDDAVAVAQFLYHTKHGRLGFKPLAAVYSLPKALSYWSIVLLGAQVAAMVFRTFNVYLMTAILVPMLLVSFMLLGFARSGFSSRSENLEESSCDSVAWWRRLLKRSVPVSESSPEKTV